MQKMEHLENCSYKEPKGGIMTDPSEDIVEIKVSMARMEGMLTQALSDHNIRLGNAEEAIRQESSKMTNHSRQIGRNEIKINNAEQDIDSIHSKLDGSLSKNIQIIMAVVASVALGLSIFQGIVPGGQF